MNNIDDDYDAVVDNNDDDDDDASDLDSILAMARRLDDASVLSDPSFIEGTSPHVQHSIDPPVAGGLGGGGGAVGGGGGMPTPSHGRNP